MPLTDVLRFDPYVSFQVSDLDKLNKLDGSDLPLLKKKEIEQVFTFLTTWVQR